MIVDKELQNLLAQLSISSNDNFREWKLSQIATHMSYCRENLGIWLDEKPGMWSHFSRQDQMGYNLYITLPSCETNTPFLRKKIIFFFSNGSSIFRNNL
jgi:hypothetical protein